MLNYLLFIVIIKKISLTIKFSTSMQKMV